MKTERKRSYISTEDSNSPFVTATSNLDHVLILRQQGSATSSPSKIVELETSGQTSAPGSSSSLMGHPSNFSTREQGEEKRQKYSRLPSVIVVSINHFLIIATEK